MTPFKTTQKQTNVKENKKMMEINEKQLKMDGNERNRGDLRIYMKIQRQR